MVVCHGGWFLSGQALLSFSSPPRAPLSVRVGVQVRVPGGPGEAAQDEDGRVFGLVVAGGAGLVQAGEQERLLLLVREGGRWVEVYHTYRVRLLERGARVDTRAFAGVGAQDRTAALPFSVHPQARHGEEQVDGDVFAAP